MGATAFPADAIVSGVLDAARLASGTPTEGFVITADASGDPVWSEAAGGGGGTPGGATTQIQYNNDGDFGGAANVTYDGTRLNAHGGNDEGVMIGDSAGDTTSDAVCIGFFTGANSTSQTSAVKIGRHAGYEAEGANSVNIGHAASQYARSCASSVHIGYLAARNPAMGATFNAFSNVVIGHEAGTQANAQQTSVIIGATAGKDATTCVGSILVGFGSGHSASASDNSVIIGNQAGYSATSSAMSVIIGAEAGQNATNSYQSVLIGFQAGKSLSRNYTLVIEGHSTYAAAGTTGLIYGEFDNRILVINGQLRTVNTATTAGLRIGSIAGDPSSVADGDIWYDSSAGELTARIDGANVALGSGGGGIGGSTGATDNRLLRADGTGAATLQNSAVTCDDSGNLSGVGTLGCGAITSSGNVYSSASNAYFGKSNCHFIFGNPTNDSIYFEQSNGGAAGPTLFSNAGLAVEQSCYFGIGGSGYAATSPDTKAYRDAAGIWAQRNAANGQKARVYRTYTSSTSGEWYEVDATGSSNIDIAACIGSLGGTARPIRIGTKSGAGTFTPSIVTYSNGTATIVLPASDPAIAGALWNNAGTLAISAG